MQFCPRNLWDQGRATSKGSPDAAPYSQVRAEAQVNKYAGPQCLEMLLLRPNTPAGFPLQKTASFPASQGQEPVAERDSAAC